MYRVRIVRHLESCVFTDEGEALTIDCEGKEILQEIEEREIPSAFVLAILFVSYEDELGPGRYMAELFENGVWTRLAGV